MSAKSTILRAMSRDGSARLLVINSKEIVNGMRIAHKTSPTVTAALGRTITAASMIGTMLPEAGDTVSITFDGDGGRIDTDLVISFGHNSILVEFDSKSGSTVLSVNGKKADIGFFASRGEAVCFVNLWSRNSTTVAIDRFIMIKKP